MRYKYFEVTIDFDSCQNEVEHQIVCTDPQWLGHTMDCPHDSRVFYYADGVDELFDLMQKRNADGWMVLSIDNAYEDL